MNDMHRQQSQNPGSKQSAGASSKQREQNQRSGSQSQGNPQSDDSYSRNEAGIHKSKLGGANQQAGSSQNPGGSQQASGSQSRRAEQAESADKADQSGETGTDENLTGNQARGGGAGRAAQKPGNQP